MPAVATRNQGKSQFVREVLNDNPKANECEACGSNSAELYSDLGDDSCEVHHRMPLSEIDALERRFVRAPMRSEGADPAAVVPNVREDPARSSQCAAERLRKGFKSQR